MVVSTADVLAEPAQFTQCDHEYLIVCVALCQEIQVQCYVVSCQTTADLLLI